MEPFHLPEVMREGGFNSRIVSGYYYVDSGQGVVERVVRSAMNIAIRFSGRLGLRIAPMWMLHAYRHCVPRQR